MTQGSILCSDQSKVTARGCEVNYRSNDLSGFPASTPFQKFGLIYPMKDTPQFQHESSLDSLLDTLESSYKHKFLHFSRQLAKSRWDQRIRNQRFRELTLPFGLATFLVEPLTDKTKQNPLFLMCYGLERQGTFLACV